MANKEDKIIDELKEKEYEFGFVSDIETEIIPKGLNEDVIRTISKKKNEPEFMLEYRLKAYKNWLKMEEPDWAQLNYKKPDFQAISYYAAPKELPKYNSLFWKISFNDSSFRAFDEQDDLISLGCCRHFCFNKFNCLSVVASNQKDRSVYFL